MTISAVVLAPFAALEGSRTPGLVTIGWLALLGTLATGGALVLFHTLIHRVGAVRANLAGYLAPAFALVYSITFLGEHITPETLAGLALILTGSAIAATYRPSWSTAADHD